jgi:hypothetical protein
MPQQKETKGKMKEVSFQENSDNGKSSNKDNRHFSDVTRYSEYYNSQSNRKSESDSASRYQNREQLHTRDDNIYYFGGERANPREFTFRADTQWSDVRNQQSSGDAKQTPDANTTKGFSGWVENRKQARTEREKIRESNRQQDLDNLAKSKSETIESRNASKKAFRDLIIEISSYYKNYKRDIKKEFRYEWNEFNRNKSRLTDAAVDKVEANLLRIGQASISFANNVRKAASKMYARLPVVSELKENAKEIKALREEVKTLGAALEQVSRQKSFQDGLNASGRSESVQHETTRRSNGDKVATLSPQELWQFHEATAATKIQPSLYDQRRTRAESPNSFETVSILSTESVGSDSMARRGSRHSAFMTSALREVTLKKGEVKQVDIVPPHPGTQIGGLTAQIVNPIKDTEH